MADSKEDKLSKSVDLEIKLTYLEDTVQELNTVVFRQQQTIDKLETALKNIKEQVKLLEDAKQSGAELPHEKPPHY